MSARQSKRKKIERLKVNQKMVFGRMNYILMGLAILLLAIGFGGMYIENEFTGWFSLYVSPVLAVAGFVTVAVAILYADKSESTEDQP